ncbi:hypothetical protein EV361DRAFT_956029 [Lentinula raphanica]|nr:hypothetical protein EV361DRAFT_956029 [Lentinula raphanica]
MSNTLGFAILELNGSNYISGRDERPKETYSGTGADRVETTSAELKKEIHEWDNKDDSAIAGIFGIFKEAINFEVREDADPAMPITNLQSIFAQLDDFGLKLTDQIQAMILLAALPHSAEKLTMNTRTKDNEK